MLAFGAYAEDAMDNGAAKALTDWNKALATAKAEAGKKGKLPKPKEDLAAALTKSATLAKTVEDQRKQLVTSIKAYQDALTNVEAACDGYSAIVNKNEFGLSKSNPDEERSINKIRNVLTKTLDEIGLGSKSPRKEAAKIRDPLETADLGSF
jgi:hypothetical protein